MGTQRMQTNRSTVLVTRRFIVIAAAVSLTTGLATDTVDRSAYDDRFGTATAWSL